jgi:uncharacterized protein (TIGR00290 family)
MKNALVSWSGGKDSCFAAMQAKGSGIIPTVLLNVLNEEGKISRSHGIPSSILEAQATAMALPIKMIASSWADYEAEFTAALIELKDQYKVTHAIFGDIDLDDHKKWEEKVCNLAGLNSVLPLWKQERKQLVLQMLDVGMQTIIISCNEKMGERFLGKLLTIELVYELETLGIDPCGEEGEFHTLVTDCPLFKNPISVSVTDKLLHQNYWFAILINRQTP